MNVTGKGHATTRPPVSERPRQTNSWDHHCQAGTQASGSGIHYSEWCIAMDGMHAPGRSE
ncbi:hypothetical protein E2C01_080848 [Portunus trituberculatus]|uniref:Uncharacterized protein n=1 Tax=Portunus trituberculatus TaxID=210409 RepID=A0A5B7IWG2_PORTR|nr:hypothetical protein [Portunus trituberculatus]